RDCLASDTDELRAALRIAQGDESEQSVPPRVTVAKRSIGNVEGSIITLDRFLRDLDARAEEADPFASIPWSMWTKIAEMKYPKAPGGKEPGTVPKQVLESSSAALVAGELLANEEIGRAHV